MSRPTASEIRAPVPYRNSSRARSRSLAGAAAALPRPGSGPAAASSRSTSCTVIALGSRRGGDGGRTCRAGSAAVRPWAAAKACSPRTATTARPAELAASGMCSPSPSRSPARKAAMSAPVGWPIAVFPWPASASQ